MFWDKFSYPVQLDSMRKLQGFLEVRYRRDKLSLDCRGMNFLWEFGEEMMILNSLWDVKPPRTSFGVKQVDGLGLTRL